MRELCDLIGGWLVHPLGALCAPAREAAAAFLFYLVTEDTGYRWAWRVGSSGRVKTWAVCPDVTATLRRHHKCCQPARAVAPLAHSIEHA